MKSKGTVTNKEATVAGAPASPLAPLASPLASPPKDRRHHKRDEHLPQEDVAAARDLWELQAAVVTT